MNLDPDILLAVKELAELRGTTAGKVLSDLARSALRNAPEAGAIRNGVPLLEPTADEGVVTSEAVNRLLEED